MVGMERRRSYVGRFAAALLAASAFTGTGAAARAAAPDVEAFRDALAAFVGQLPEPVNNSQRRALERLTGLVEDLSDPPASLAEEIALVVAVWGDLPGDAAVDEGVASAVSALLASYGPQVQAALDELEAELAQYGTPGPPPVRDVRDRIAQAREALADAADGALPARKRIRALGKAAKRFAQGLARLEAFEAESSDCAQAIQSDTLQIASATITVNGGEPIEIDDDKILAAGSGKASKADFSAWIVGITANFRFVVRQAAIRAGEIPLTADDDFTAGVFVTFRSGTATEYVADTGAFRITSITLQRYPPPIVGGVYTKYLRIRGTFSGSGHPRDQPDGVRASIEAEFECCEIRFDPK